MDESFDQYDEDAFLDAELLEEALLEAELLEAQELPLAVPTPIPCDPDLPPLEVDAQDFEDEGEVPPVPLCIEAADLEDEDEDEAETEDETDGEDLSPAPFGIDDQDFDPDAPPPVELANPDEIFAGVDPTHEPW